jgi:tRNA (mo5U34)-methyltransferase
MNPETLRAEVIRLGPWHHDIEIVPGVRTGAISRSQTYPSSTGPVTIIDPNEAMTHFVRSFYANGLESRSVLDCACNAGGWLFAAADAGAGRCFGFDIREHWIRQAQFVAANRPSENVQFMQCELAALPELALGQFDLTLFNGIFYHLPDPVAGLRIAADHTRELLVVNTMIAKKSTDALVLRPESPTDVMSGIHGLSWIPGSERVLQEILAWCGFPHTRVWFRMAGEDDQDRIAIVGARDPEVFAHYDSTQPQKSTRKWRLFRQTR